MTTLASTIYSEQGIDEIYLPSITRMCVQLGPVGLATVGVISLLIMGLMFHWRQTTRAVVISAIAFLACMGFYVLGFLAAISTFILVFREAK